MEKMNTGISPYFDDFDETKHFHRVLFKPEVAVQARELNTAQSIQQNQINQFGDHIFKNGSVVRPGGTSYKPVPFIRVQQTYLGVAIDPTQYLNNVIVQDSTGLRAQVNFIVTDTTEYRFYLNYLNSGSLGTTREFNNTEAFHIEAAPGIQVVYGQPNATNHTGVGQLASIADGTYYVNGFFVGVDAQTVEMGTDASTLSVTVGLEVIEEIVTHMDDESLYDNAMGSPNENAPGADRLKISLLFKSYALTTDLTGKVFIELLRFEDGILKVHKINSEYSDLERTLARRTYDESGDYSIAPYQITALNHQKLFQGDSQGLVINGNPDWFVLAVGPGKSYVRGHELETISNEYVTGVRARGTDHIIQTDDKSLVAYSGQYIWVAGFISGLTAGIPATTNFSISLFSDTAFTTQIGTATVRGVQLDQDLFGQPGTPNINAYRFYIHTLSMNPGHQLSESAAWKNSASNHGVVLHAVSLINVNAPFITGDIITESQTLRTATIYRWIPELATALVYRQDPANQIPRQGKLISSGTKTATVQSVISNNITGDALNIPTLFTLPNQYIKSVRDASNASEVSFYYLKPVQVTADSNGIFTSGTVTATNESLETNLSEYIGVVQSGASAGFMPMLSTQMVISSDQKSFIWSPIGLAAANFVGATATFLVPIYKTNVVEKTKTKTTITNEPVSIASIATSYVNLTKADVIRIVSITDPGNSDRDITSDFLFDNGQRDYVYKLGSIMLKPGANPPVGSGGNINVTYEYFSHSSGDYISVNSYPAFEEIPQFVSRISGNTYNLRDCLDFRPIENGAASSFLLDQSRISFSYQYYTHRIDKLILTSDGTFKLLKGVPGSAIAPQALDSSMPIADITVLPYTYTNKDIFIKMYDNRRYTMRDIGKLDARITNVENYTTLSLLEMDTKNLKITDAETGLDRFKSGFFVDSFDSYESGNRENPEFNCTVYYDMKSVYPQEIRENIPLQFNALDSDSVAQVGNKIMLPYTEVTKITQPYATHTVNLQPYDSYFWEGKIQFFPSEDVWNETAYLPDVTTSSSSSYSQTVTNNVYHQPLPYQPLYQGWTSSTQTISTSAPKIITDSWLRYDDQGAAYLAAHPEDFITTDGIHYKQVK
jgi:hypothetical protein